MQCAARRFSVNTSSKRQAQECSPLGLTGTRQKLQISNLSSRKARTIWGTTSWAD